MTTQLDQIQATLATVVSKLNRIDLQNQQQTGLLTSLNAGVQLIMASLTDLSAQIDASTTAISDKLAAESAKLDAEGAVITSVVALVADLRTQIANGVAPQAVLDQLASIGTRLETAAATIDASTTTIDAHTAQLAALNPAVPGSIPTVEMVKATN